MKKYTVAAMALLMSATLASASQPSKSATVAAKAKTHVVVAEVVKIDAEAKTLTVKDDKGSEMTMPLAGKALTELKAVKVGEKVDLTCRDNDKGEHQAIVNIKAAKPAMAQTMAHKSPKK